MSFSYLQALFCEQKMHSKKILVLVCKTKDEGIVIWPCNKDIKDVNAKSFARKFANIDENYC